MRHYNPKNSSWKWNPLHYKGEKVMRPYYRPYTYTRPNSKRTYIKVLQYIYDHPNCTRFDIQVGIFGYKNDITYKKCARGNQSALFANLIYDDLIDYDKSYKYTITSKGMALLKQVYLNDIAKVVNKV